MTRDTYDVSIRRASQLSHKLEIFRSSPTTRRPSTTTSYMAKRSLLREDFRGSDRTLVSSSLDSKNSSRSNVHTLASSSYYTNSNTDVLGSDRTDEDEEEDEENDDDDGREKPEVLEQDRGIWERKFHYILLGFGAIFGVRNILDFPALALEHGGGAFLFVFVVLTFTVGLPIVYLEVSLGQYARGGVVKAWRILPLARGIAICSLLLTLTRSAYSATPAVWAMYYLYSAVVGSLPRLNSSSTEYAYPGGAVSNMSNASSSSHLLAFLHQSSYNTSSNFLFFSTLEITDSISSMGHVIPHMIICLIIVWTLVFLLAALGPRLIGKISFMFTAIPSVLLVVMLIAACTLSGSVLGIQTFLNPRWHRLSAFKPWLDGLDLVLSSLTCGTGVLITLSGHCSFHGNTFRNAISMTLLSLVMTIVSGCLMFALLGVEQNVSGVLVETKARTTDVELGFVLFPTATSNLPAPNFWIGIFCMTVLLFSIVQAAAMVHHFQQGVVDLVHLKQARIHWKVATLATVVVVMMSFNIFTTAQNGLYVLRLLQLSVPRLTAPIICAAQCVTVGWGYGVRRFAGRVTEMTGRNKSLVWKWLWRWACPVLLSLYSLASVLTTNLIQNLPQQDMGKRWLYGIAWAINTVILFPGVAMAAGSFFKVRGTFKQRLKQLRSTPSTWGPGHPEHEPQADLPDYVICHPDPFRPANALAMLTANLYLPNIVNFVNMQSVPPETDLPPAFISDVATLTGSDDDGSINSPNSRESIFGRCHATVLCLSHVIGLGNIVRFPYLAYRHGGGAFLIAYTVVLITCGIPLVIIETAIGQFSSLGPIPVWRSIPMFKGVGYSMVVISVVTSIYYSVVTSWSLYYLATSLTSLMPWQECTNEYNTNSCRVYDERTDLCSILNDTTFENTTFLPPSSCEGVNDPQCARKLNSSSLCQDMKVTNVKAGLANSSVNPSDEYFYLSVVKVSSSWNEVGELRWQLLLCLLLTWLVIVLFLIKGLKPGGKTTYLILFLTCTLLLILLVRSSSLLGGQEGLSHLFTPQWYRLIHAQVWRDAASQVFFSLSLGSGTLVAMGTCNKFNNNVFREAILLCVIDGGMSLLCSLVIFAVIGALAHEGGLAMEDAARADLGLTFVTLSYAVLQLPWSLFWAILIFLTLVLCGVCTCVAAMATVVASLLDLLSTSLKKQRTWLLLALCSGAALFGLPFILQVGFFAVDLLDTHLSGLPQLCVGGAVALSFAWIYGYGRLCSDLKRMTHSSVSWVWKLLWIVICPTAITMLFLGSVMSLTADTYNDSYPRWASVFGLVLWFLLLTPIVIGIVHEVTQQEGGTFLEKVRRSCQAKKEWGATLHRGSSQVEYYPTVHTHLGLDISTDGLHTVTDHVEFTAISVRVPSLSETTLLPVSPGMPRGKKPLDMRHKAILNHAYSNPQCNFSSGSLEKIEKKKPRITVSVSQQDLNDVIIVKKVKRTVITCEASTQTDPTYVENKLYRQRSQPIVHVTKPVQIMTRSSSWHQLAGQPAVLEVNTKQIANSKKHIAQRKSPQNVSRRCRRYGQSVAPNLEMLIGREGVEAKPLSPGVSCQVNVPEENDRTAVISPEMLTLPVNNTVSPVSAVSPVGTVAPVIATSPVITTTPVVITSPTSVTAPVSIKSPTITNPSSLMASPAMLTLAVATISPVDPGKSLMSDVRQKNTTDRSTKALRHGRASICGSSINGVNYKSKSNMPLTIHNQPTIYYARRKQTLGSQSTRSRSVEEAPVSMRRAYDVYGPSQGIDVSFSVRTKSADSDYNGVMRRLSTSSIKSADYDRFLTKGQNKDKPCLRRGGNVILEEDDTTRSDEYMQKFDVAYQIMHAETEVSKL